jgi:uracil phosphoribosyltransferase
MAATLEAAAATSLYPQYPRLFVLPATNQLRALLTMIRDRDTERSDFVFYADRLIRLLVEEGACVRAYGRATCGQR